ncbi:CDGSH iron-sulfur domain-containing protein 3, mitochondrial [Callorhinchus milii]|uniref:CDGSH iron-sulfur domain-containing protein 3-like protein n=1 Tax=Callorhinchus milii TaxID=7868 RepID=K4FTG2_CALMI|nr:CDGSH iron-sulfur domain-containing protein 3, mitochondrial [Callorhinchus milii]AFK11443.1 CDGSH iron-sulfur domain-containing protein 3-like protein [Callorhinchus milii]|eukprot:gi/632972155/ref/XP_007902521.1/ PREDICTED: CDGSH iron-sulfur domain-containing protein 3, mitochondrial [Callorhinchus milii]
MSFIRGTNRFQVSLQQVIRSWYSTSGLPNHGVIAAKQPFKVELEMNKPYTWCACGYSRKQPFCDGTHNSVQTKMSPIKFNVEMTGYTLLCGCKQTANSPYCDGTHKKNWVQQASLSTCPSRS